MWLRLITPTARARSSSARNTRIADVAVMQHRRCLAFVTSTADACHSMPPLPPRSLFGNGNPVPHFINVTVVELVQRSSARIASAQSTGQ